MKVLVNDFLLEEGWDEFLKLLKEEDALSLIPQEKLPILRKVFFAVRYSTLPRKKSLYDFYDLLIDNNGFGEYLLKNLSGSRFRVSRKDVRMFLNSEVSDSSYLPFKNWLNNKLY